MVLEIRVLENFDLMQEPFFGAFRYLKLDVSVSICSLLFIGPLVTGSCFRVFKKFALGIRVQTLISGIFRRLLHLELDVLRTLLFIGRLVTAWELLQPIQKMGFRNQNPNFGLKSPFFDALCKRATFLFFKKRGKFICKVRTNYHNY
jgi:hypothetical protein